MFFLSPTEFSFEVDVHELILGLENMGISDRSKKRVQLWKKAMFHFLLCFVMGFFTGFAPASRESVLTKLVASSQPIESPEFSPEPIEMLHQVVQVGNISRSLITEAPAFVPTSTNVLDQVSRIEQEEEDLSELVPRKQLIIITTTTVNDAIQGAFLRRMANTLALVPPPLLWIVVEPHSDSSEMCEILRRTPVMYRHLVYKENFTDAEAEIDYQQNVALKHIEHHHLNGIVHFSDLYNFYDLDFFGEIREIEVFGTWPIAQLSANRKRVVVEGPICNESEVVGWHLKDSNDQPNVRTSLHISSFAFNTSLLWDPERWGRPTSQETLQNSIKIVQQVVAEEETKLKGLPQGDCSKIMLWHLHLPSQLILIKNQSATSSDDNSR